MANAVQTRSTADAILHDIWGEGGIVDLAYELDPAIGLIPSDTTWNGRNYKESINYARNQSLGGDFATAQAVNSNNKYEAWDVTPAEYFGFAVINRTLVRTAPSMGEAGVDALESETQGTVNALLEELGFQLYNDGTANRGQISSTSNAGTATITLADITKAAYFEIGMKVFSDADPGTGSSSNTGSVEITKVNRGTGALTASGNWSTGITTAAASDYLFRAGDFGGSGKCIKGFAAWLPDAAPTAGDSHFGVDRSVDPERLAGARMGASGKTVEEAILDMASKLAGVSGCKPDYCFLNHTKWNELSKEMLSRGVRYIEVKNTTGTTGYKALEVMGPKGTIKVIGSPFCPYHRGYMIQLDTWKFKSAGDMPEMFSDDNNTILRQASANNYEARFGWVAQLVCKAPAKNGVIEFNVAPGAV